MYNYNNLRGWKIKPILVDPQIKMHNFYSRNKHVYCLVQQTVLTYVAKFSF